MPFFLPQRIPCFRHQAVQRRHGKFGSDSRFGLAVGLAHPTPKRGKFGNSSRALGEGSKSVGRCAFCPVGNKILALY
jgi:hypothetical protein